MFLPCSHVICAFIIEQATAKWSQDSAGFWEVWKETKTSPSTSSDVELTWNRRDLDVCPLIDHVQQPMKMHMQKSRYCINKHGCEREQKETNT